jgi:ATP-dependent 26S proteasome regulatory subunit
MSEPKEQTVVDYKSLNSDRIVDDVINAATANSIANIISKNGFTFDSKNIGILLLLTSLGDVKKIVVEIIEFTKKYLFEHFSWIVSQIPDYIMNSIIIKHINSYFYKESDVQKIIKQPTHNTKTIKINNEEIFLSLIYYFEQNSSLGKLSKELIETEYNSFSDIRETYYYNNIITKNGIEIFLNKNISYVNGNFERNNNNSNNEMICIENLYEYLNNPDYKKHNYPEWINVVKLTSDTVIMEEVRIYMPKSFDDKMCISMEDIIYNIITEIDDSKIGKSINCIFGKHMKNFLFFMTYLASRIKDKYGNEAFFKPSPCGKYIVLPEINLKIKITNNEEYANRLKNKFCFEFLEKPKYKSINPQSSVYYYYQDYITNNKNNNDPKNITIKTTNKTINLDKYSNTLLQDAFEFYKSQQSNEKIKIFNLSINRTFEEEKKENPEYETFEKNKDNIIEKMKNIEDKDIKTEMMKQFKNPPPQFLIEHKESINVKSDFVSEQSKPIDTLYLRKKDMFQLKSVLNNFGNCSEIYEELGIRKKLGLMFHGVPGTGKSTSIVTIASYLKKDIYYLNMNTIKTNAELQMIFDYVLKNCSKTGIIVIEEIEKQTNVVLKNHELKDETMTDILEKKEGKLNLSYFLNLLDGTLSQEETVYIMTTNHIDKLEPALYRAGRIDKMIEFKKCDKYQIEIIYERIMKRKIDSDVLDSIPEDVYTPADIIFHLVSYIYETELDDRTIMEKFIKEY